MWRATVKGLLGHKLRFALTALAVTLGVAFVTGSFVFTDTLGSAFGSLFGDTLAGVDIQVQPKLADEFQLSRPERMSTALLDSVSAVEGVEQVTGSLFGIVQLVGPDGEVASGFGPPTFGASWPDRVSAFEIAEGTRPTASAEAAIDAATAKRLDIQIGDEVEVVSVGAPKTFVVSGLATFAGAEGFGGASIILFDLPVAQELFNAADRYDTLEIAAAPDTEIADLVPRVQAVLPTSLEAVDARSVAEEQAARLKEGLGFFTTFLLVFAGISLFVGTFIIQNTFRIVVAQRTRELALLRALGASRRQVTTMVLAEAFLVGLAASAIGLALGIALAFGLRTAYSLFGGSLPSNPLEIAGRTIGIAFAVGIVVTMVSSFLPAWRAGAVPPLAAMRDVAASSTSSLRGRLRAGTPLLALGIAAMALGLFANVPSISPITLVGVGAAIVFVAVAVVSPLIARPVARLVGAPLPALRGLAGGLATQNAMRSRRRTAATAAALMVGLALVSTAAILASSLRATVSDLIDENFKADLVVGSAGFGAGFTPDLTEEVRALPEVESAASLRGGQVLVDDDRSFLAGVDVGALAQFFSIETIDGALEGIADGGVAVRASRAESAGIQVGDTLTLTFPVGGEQQVPVAAIWDAQGLDASLLISLDTYAQRFVDQLDTQALIRLAPGVSIEEGKSAVQAVTDGYPNVRLLDRDGFRDQAEGQINGLLGLIFVLLALAILVAFLGITNTLSLSVIERTREIGLLRAVGMSRRQVRTMIRWEAAIIAVFGAVLGIALGIAFGWSVVRALSDQGLRFELPQVQLIAAVIGAGAAGIVAAVLPAARASRLDVLAAIAYE